jgi:hypothetical protein
MTLQLDDNARALRNNALGFVYRDIHSHSALLIRTRCERFGANNNAPLADCN